MSASIGIRIPAKIHGSEHSIEVYGSGGISRIEMKSSLSHVESETLATQDHGKGFSRRGV